MYIVFDIGGTKMRISVSRNGENFDEPKIFETPKDFNEGIELFASAAREFAGGEKIKAAAGGIAGPLDRMKTKLINSPNIKDWIGKPLKEEMQKLIDAPVFIENDAVLVALGEAVAGAGRGEEIVAYITVSTGVGGARIVDGKIDKNIYGFEPGHQIINPFGELCSICGFAGHLESHISGTALEKHYHQKPHEITDPKIWEEEAKLLAYGLNNTIVHWSPNIVVLGGSMITKEPGISIDRVRYYLERDLSIFPELPKLVKASLGDVGGLYGALVFLRQHLP